MYLIYNHKASFCCSIKSIFINTFLPKPKPILVKVLNRQPDKPSFIEYLKNSIKEINISNIQKCCQIGDFNANLLSGNKKLWKKQYSDSFSQAPLIVKKTFRSLIFSLHKLIMKPTRTTEYTKTLIDHILSNSPEKFIQSGVIEVQ